MDQLDEAQRLAQQCADAMLARDTASSTLGMALASIAPGMSTMTMTVREDMVNGHGICHGGFIFTFADSAFAFACNSYDQLTVAAAADISFLRPVKAGETLTAVAREVFRKGRNGIYDILVTNQAGETVAVFRGKSRTLDQTIL